MENFTTTPSSIVNTNNKVGFYDLIGNQFMPSSNPNTEFSAGII